MKKNPYSFYWGQFTPIGVRDIGILLCLRRLSHADKQLNRIGLPRRIWTLILWSVVICPFQLNEWEINGGRGRIRTCDFQVMTMARWPTSLLCDIKSKEVMAAEGYKSSIYSTWTPYSLVAPRLRLLTTVGHWALNDTQHVCFSLLGYLLRPNQAVGTLLLLLSVGQKFSPTNRRTAHL